MHQSNMIGFIGNTRSVRLRSWIALLMFAVSSIIHFSCTSTMPVRTVGKGNSALEVTAGGPLFSNLGPTIPIPNLLVGARYGISEEMDISAHYNLTSAFIKNISMHLNTSAIYIPVQPGIGRQSSSPLKGHSLGLSFHIQWISDFSTSLMVLPALEPAYGYRFNWFTPYISTAVCFNIYRPDDSYNSVNLYPAVGMEFTFRERTSLTLEFSLSQPFNNLHGTQMELISVVEDAEEEKRYGQIGISIGFSRCFGDTYTNQEGAEKR